MKVYHQRVKPSASTTRLRDTAMLIGEAAKAAGVSVQTLHFYERERLIPRPVRSDSGYRLYTPEIIERVRFIRKAQSLDFSLDEIKKILGLATNGMQPCGHVQRALAKKLREVDHRLEVLRGFRSELAALVAQAAELSDRHTHSPICPIVEEASPLPLTSISKLKLAPKRNHAPAKSKSSPQSSKPGDAE